MIFSRKCFITVAATVFSLAVSAQTRYISTERDTARAAEIMETLYNAKKAGVASSTQDLMVIAAKLMLETPYVAGTLDVDPLKEDLRIYLTKTDCILFVEACIDLARTVKASSDVPLFEDFAEMVASTRYRCEPPFSYSDRIHYTTEWIRRQEGGSLKDITLDLGGEVYDHPVGYMSKNYKRYAQLKDAANIPRAALDLDRIGKVEEELNKEPMTFIPSSEVAGIAGKIQSGDIICYVSKVDGLDIAHVAMAVVENGRVGFIHASQNAGKVVIDSQTIAEYVNSRSNLSGIKVIRPL